MDLLVQVTGLLVLLSALAWGYRRWIRPRQGLSRQGQGLVLLIILTLMGGIIGGIGWWFNDPRSFSWALPALASRILASAGWAFGVLTWSTLEKPTYHRVRLTLLMLSVYLLPLLVAIVLFHLDRFDYSAAITYAFFVIVLGMLVPCLWYLIRQPQVEPEQSAVEVRQKDRLLQGWLALITVVTGLWGLALFWTDQGSSDLIWVWPGDLLTSRLIAVMLLTIAAGALYSLRNTDLSQLMVRLIIAYGLGVVVASLWNVLSGRPVKLLYVIGFGFLSLGSILLLLKEQRKGSVEIQAYREPST
jgi:hypothetical protein